VFSQNLGKENTLLGVTLHDDALAHGELHQQWEADIKIASNIIY